MDLSAYHTDESATDIEGLRRLLKIDSLSSWESLAAAV